MTKPDFWKKMCLQNILLIVSKIGVFGHFLEIATLDFANFAYNDRQEWYLVDPCSSSVQKKYLRLLWRFFAYWLSQYLKKMHICLVYPVWMTYIMRYLNYNCSLLMTVHWWWCSTLLRRYFAYWLSQYMKNVYFWSLFALIVSYMVRNLNYKLLSTNDYPLVMM